MVNPPAQRIGLLDGPAVHLRRASDHCLRNREILEGSAKGVICPGLCRFHELRQNASAIRDVIHKYGRMRFDNNCPIELVREGPVNDWLWPHRLRSIGVFVLNYFREVN